MPTDALEVHAEEGAGDRELLPACVNPTQRIESAQSCPSGTKLIVLPDGSRLASGVDLAMYTSTQTSGASGLSFFYRPDKMALVQTPEFRQFQAKVFLF